MSNISNRKPVLLGNYDAVTGLPTSLRFSDPFLAPGKQYAYSNNNYSLAFGVVPQLTTLTYSAAGVYTLGSAGALAEGAVIGLQSVDGQYFGFATTGAAGMISTLTNVQFVSTELALNTTISVTVAALDIASSSFSVDGNRVLNPNLMDSTTTATVIGTNFTASGSNITAGVAVADVNNLVTARIGALVGQGAVLEQWPNVLNLINIASLSFNYTPNQNAASFSLGYRDNTGARVDWPAAALAQLNAENRTLFLIGPDAGGVTELTGNAVARFDVRDPGWVISQANPNFALATATLTARDGLNIRNLSGTDAASAGDSYTGGLVTSIPPTDFTTPWTYNQQLRQGVFSVFRGHLDGSPVASFLFNALIDDQIRQLIESEAGITVNANPVSSPNFVDTVTTTNSIGVAFDIPDADPNNIMASVSSADVQAAAARQIDIDVGNAAAPVQWPSTSFRTNLGTTSLGISLIVDTINTFNNQFQIQDSGAGQPSIWTVANRAAIVNEAGVGTTLYILDAAGANTLGSLTFSSAWDFTNVGGGKVLASADFTLSDATRTWLNNADNAAYLGCTLNSLPLSKFSLTTNGFSWLANHVSSTQPTGYRFAADPQNEILRLAAGSAAGVSVDGVRVANPNFVDTASTAAAIGVKFAADAANGTINATIVSSDIHVVLPSYTGGGLATAVQPTAITLGAGLGGTATSTTALTLRAALPVQNTGVAQATPASTLNFSGAVFGTVDANGVATINAGIPVESRNVDQGVATSLDFTGMASAVYDGSSREATVTVNLPVSNAGAARGNALALNFDGFPTITTDANGIATITTPGVNIRDQGVAVGANTPFIDFIGNAITATDSGSGLVTVNVPGLTIIDTDTTPATTISGVVSLTLSGAGVTVASPSAGSAVATIPGYVLGIRDSGVSVNTNVNIIDFGAGLTVANEGSNQVRVDTNLQANGNNSAGTAVTVNNVSTFNFGSGIAITSGGTGIANISVPSLGAARYITALAPLQATTYTNPSATYSQSTVVGSNVQWVVNLVNARNNVQVGTTVQVSGFTNTLYNRVWYVGSVSSDLVTLTFPGTTAYGIVTGNGNFITGNRSAVNADNALTGMVLDRGSLTRTSFNFNGSILTANSFCVITVDFKAAFSSWSGSFTSGNEVDAWFVYTPSGGTAVRSSQVWGTPATSTYGFNALLSLNETIAMNAGDTLQVFTYYGGTANDAYTLTKSAFGSPFSRLNITEVRT